MNEAYTEAELSEAITWAKEFALLFPTVKHPRVLMAALDAETENGRRCERFLERMKVSLPE